MNPKRNAEIFILTPSGSAVLQHRDDIPGITNPGMFTTFGGKVEHGETPLEAAVRELGEETNLQIPADRFVYYGTYNKTREEHGEDWIVDFFVVLDVDIAGLAVFEGQGFKEVETKQELETLNTSILFKEFAEDWYSGWRDFLFMPDPPKEFVDELIESYYNKAKSGHSPSDHPFAICPAGLVAAGKSTVCTPLAQTVDAIQISSDEIREIIYKQGYNFRNVITLINDALVSQATADKYSVFLDRNCATSPGYVRISQKAGYTLLTIHVNPDEEFIRKKIKSGRMDHKLTFFKDDVQVLRSLELNKAAHYAALPKFIDEFGIWATFDPSKDTVAQLQNIELKLQSLLEENT